MSQSFEEEFREIAGNHEEKLDLTALWNNVETAIVQDKKQRKGFWFFLLFGAMISVLLIALYWNKQRIDHLPEVTTTAILDEAERPLIENVASSESTMDNAETEASEIRNRVINQPIQNTKSNSSNPLKADGLPEIFTKRTRNIVPLNNGRGLSSALLPENSEKSGENDVVKKVFSTGLNNDQRSTLLQKLGLLGIQYSSDSQGLKLSKNSISKNNIKPESKKKIKRIRLSSAISLGKQYYQGNITDDFYRSLERFDFSLETPLKAINNWSIWSGINYGIFTDEFSWEGKYFIDKNEEYLSNRIYQVGLQVQEVYSNGEVKYMVEQKLLKYNRRSVISIPLKVLYEKRMNRWNIDVFASMFLNYQLANEYYYIDHNGAPQMELSTRKFSEPSFVFGSNLGYRLTPDKMLLTGIHIQSSKHGFENAIEKQIFKDTRVGFSLGIQYKY